MAQFRIDYTNVKRQTHELSQQLSMLQIQIDNLGNLQRMIAPAWSGCASETYQEKLLNLKERMENTKRQIQNMIDIIDQTADRIKREEEEQAAKAAMLHVCIRKRQ